MKKTVVFVFSVLVILLIPLGVCANNVSNIDITANILPDGSAEITQVWQGDFNEGTENYISINTSDIEITDFGVIDEGGNYEYTDNWDIDSSFNEKSRKCGIVQNGDNKELCFGISEYGSRRYVIKYKVLGFIKSFDDYDGANFMFINPGMNTFPTNATVTITAPEQLNMQNAKIWAFRYEGNIEFSDGAVKAYTTSPLKGDNAVIIAVRLNKGIVSPTAAHGGSFDKVLDEAKKGSDYGDTDQDDGSIFGMVIALAMAFILIFAGISAIIRKIKIKKLYKSADYFRDIPCENDIRLTHALASRFGISKNNGQIIGALLLSMLNDGSIKCETQIQTGFAGTEKAKTGLRLVCRPDKEPEGRLYDIIKAAAGEDEVLSDNELKKYSKRHPNVLMDFVDDTTTYGDTAAVNENIYKKRVSGSVGNLTDKGRQRVCEIMGFKKYLLDFSLINEKSAEDTVIWKDYMVYAMLLGIAEKAMEQFKKLYPERITEFDEYYNNNFVHVYGYYYIMNNSYKDAVKQRNSGTGGGASLGGGGGFSGGGFGGGSR